MKRRDWFKCFLALPFISVLKTEAKEKEYKFPKQGVNSFEYHGDGWYYGLYAEEKTQLPTPSDNSSPRNMATRHTLRPHPTPTPSCTMDWRGKRCGE